MKIVYLPLEPYKERYTEFLTSWTINRWSGVEGIELITVEGEDPRTGDGIRVGSVLDAYARSYWACTQMAKLATVFEKHQLRYADVIYLDDMFTPGYEMLPYILLQRPMLMRPRIFARNHAQTVDPDDFTAKIHMPWMRYYEQMVYSTADGIICASSAHAELMKVAMLDSHRAAIHVLGLPYDENAVLRAAGQDFRVSSLYDRQRRVIYSSRFDEEKQPEFFLNIVERLGEEKCASDKIEFVVCTGSETVRGNPADVDRLHALEKAGKITVKTNCTKQEYYRTLASSRVQINTARQDFISYTAIEASTFGTPTLAPAFRSFPETFRNNPTQLYVPWSLDDACNKLLALVNLEVRVPQVHWLSATQHHTLDRILDLMFTDMPGENWWDLEWEGSDET